MKRGLHPVDEGEIRLRFAAGRLAVEQFYLQGKKKQRYRMDLSGNLDFSEGLLPVGRIKAQGGGGPGLALFKLPWIDRLKVGMNPVDLEFRGPGQPVKITGNITLQDTLFVMLEEEEQAKGKSQAADSAREEELPVELDLRVSLKDNITFDKPARTRLRGKGSLLSNFLQAVKTGVLDPAMTVQLRRTEQDLLVAGPLARPQVRGKLDIIKGKLNLLGRDFTIDTGKVNFEKGHRADITAKAYTVLREDRGPGQAAQSVRVEVNVVPHDEATLARLGRLDDPVNFSLDQDSFSSDPPRSTEGILSLLVLGADVTTASTEEEQQGQAGVLAGAAVTRAFQVLASAVTSLLPASWRAKSKNFLRLDYFRVSPRFNRGSNQVATEVGGQDSLLRSQFENTDIVMDAGVSVTDALFLRAEMVHFAERERAATAISDANVRNLAGNGFSLGGEYYVNPSRMLEGKWNYQVDSNLEALPLVPGETFGAQSLYVGIRNTVPKRAYAASTAAQRRRKLEE
jgi:hypothetical protein